MKLLVTGACGQLGQSISERVRNHTGIELIALDRPELDLERPGTTAAAICAAAPDIVINAAAYTAVDQAEDEPERAFRVNAGAAGEIAAAAARAGASVIQISTDYVFDGNGSGAYDEQAATRPLGAYGRSKLAGEMMVRDANPRHAIVRTAWLYSPFGHNFVKSIMAAAATRPKLTVVDDQHGSPTSALDLADGLLAMVQQGVPCGETFHLAGSGTASWCEFAREIMDDCASLGLAHAEIDPIGSVDWPTKAVRPENSILDSRKFERSFGFVMPDWRISVRQVIDRLAQLPMA